MFSFDEFVITHISREENGKANALAQQAFSYTDVKRTFTFESRCKQKPSYRFWTSLIGVPSENTNSAMRDDSIIKGEDQDWRIPIISYLKDPGRGAGRNVWCMAFKYVLINDELSHWTAEDLLLKFLDSNHQSRVYTGEVHEGICVTHQFAPNIKRLFIRDGFYWSTMMSDCFKYYKGCEEYQWFGDLQLVPAVLRHPIIKPWLFRGWGLDFIGQINPPSSKEHRFVLVTTDYFTKWTETVPLKNMTHKEVIEFITEHIIHRFGIP